VTYYYDMISAN